MEDDIDEVEIIEADIVEVVDYLEEHGFYQESYYE